MTRPDYIPVPDAASIADRNVQTIYRWMDSKRIGSLRKATRRYVHLGSLLRYLEERKEGPE